MQQHYISTVLDILGHEYGYTPDYILWHLSRVEVEAMLAAVGRRYARQAEAMKPEKATRPPAVQSDDAPTTNIAAFAKNPNLAQTVGFPLKVR